MPRIHFNTLKVHREGPVGSAWDACRGAMWGRSCEGLPLRMERFSHKKDKARRGSMSRANIEFWFSALFSKQSLLQSGSKILNAQAPDWFSLTHILAFHAFPIFRGAWNRAGKDSQAK